MALFKLAPSFRISDLFRPSIIRVDFMRVFSVPLRQPDAYTKNLTHGRATRSRKYFLVCASSDALGRLTQARVRLD